MTEEGDITTTGGEELNLSVSELGLDGDELWVATQNGLGLTEDDGTSWRLFFKGDGIADDVILSVNPRGEVIGCSCWDEYHYWHGGEDYYTGAGVSISTDGGDTWATYGDDEGLDGSEGYYDIPWDICVDEDDDIWVATWTDYLYRTKNYGNSWEQLVPTDGTSEVVWCNDISKSGNIIWLGGEPRFARGEIMGEEINWTIYGQNSDLVGNWYPAIYSQNEETTWVSTFNVNSETGVISSLGVYLTRNGGETWELKEITDGQYNYSSFALTSIGDTVYAGTFGYTIIDNYLVSVVSGIAYTEDYGENWDFITTADGLPSNYITSLVASENGYELWAGTDNGVAVSYDQGETWTAIDYSKGFEGLDGLSSIVYPNPFFIGSGSVCFFKFYVENSYSVDLEIFDFAGTRVKTLLNSQREGPGEVEVAWLGKNENGEYVANGVYFYTIKLDGVLKSTGKVAILQ